MPMSHKDLWVKIKKESKGKSPRDEIHLLEDYLSDWPEYKGPYQELRKKLERRVAELRKVERVLASHSASQDPFSIRKRGLAQVALVGLPNVGKTSVLNALTGSDAEVADYPYTTLVPNVGMFGFGAMEFEVVDLPPFPEGRLDELHYASGLKQATLNATIVCPVVDLSADRELQLDRLLEHLRSIGRPLVGEARTGGGAEREAGVGSKEETAGPEPARPSTVISEERSILIGTGRDRVDESGADGIDVSGEDTAGLIPNARLLPFPLGEGGRRRVAEAFCEAIGMFVVLARDPSSRDEPVAYALPAGATVLDLARQIHKDLARSAKNGRVWGASADFDGQEVGLDHGLMQGDTVEVVS